MTDDRPDTTFLGNWRFWMILVICAGIDALLIWAAVAAS
jgi:hypothetical protein